MSWNLVTQRRGAARLDVRGWMKAKARDGMDECRRDGRPWLIGEDSRPAQTMMRAWAAGTRHRWTDGMGWQMARA